MQERVQKLKDDVAKSRDRYEQTLSEIKEYNPVYIESMTNVFRKCQEMEETRLCFFKNVLFSIHKCLNISEDPSLPQIYKEFHHTINNADHQKDLKWWSNNHGVNMGMSWPTFVVSANDGGWWLLRTGMGACENATSREEEESFTLHFFLCYDAAFFN